MKSFSVMRRGLRLSATALFLCGAVVTLAACSNDSNSIGPAQSDHGPMGTTATPSRADVPGSNSQSTPVMKPQ